MAALEDTDVVLAETDLETLFERGGERFVLSKRDQRVRPLAEHVELQRSVTKRTAQWQQLVKATNERWETHTRYHEALRVEMRQFAARVAVGCAAGGALIAVLVDRLVF